MADCRIRDSVRDALYAPMPVAPRPGETLYSVFGRWIRQSGATQAEPLMRVVTGGSARVLSMALPCRLDWMRSNLAPFAGTEIEDMIRRFTVAPLYRPFLPEKNWASVVRLLASETGSTSARARLGLARFGHEKRAPVHCRICMREQVHEYGFAYWLMHFALPNVTACPKHGTILEEVPCYSDILVGKNPWLGVPVCDLELEGRSGPTLDDAPAQASEQERKLSKLVIELFESGLASVLGPVLSETYAARLRQMGFVEPGGRIKRTEWGRTAEEYWGDLPFGGATPSYPYPWWTKAMHTSIGARTRSPLQHLLLIGVLFGDVKTWVATLEANGQKPPRGRHDIQKDWLRMQPLKGSKLVQLDVWVGKSRKRPPVAAKEIPQPVITLLMQGLPVSLVCKQTGIPRMTLYRRLWANREIAEAWARAAIKREYELRFGRAAGSGIPDDGFDRTDTYEGNQAWLYRHIPALELLKAHGDDLPVPSPDKLGIRRARKVVEAPRRGTNRKAT